MCVSYPSLMCCFFYTFHKNPYKMHKEIFF